MYFMQPGPPAKRVAFYGGSFDPPHAGHQQAVLHALENLVDLDCVYVAPVYKRPYGKALAPFADRLEMCRRLFLPFRDVVVTPVEQLAIDDGHDGLTCNTLKYLFGETPPNGRPWYGMVDKGAKVFLVLGSDLFDQFYQWEGYKQIQEMVDQKRVYLYWVERKDPALSSTHVRRRIKMRVNTDGLLPPMVRSYIDVKGLYR